jgi:hypothetical protein
MLDSHKASLISTLDHVLDREKKTCSIPRRFESAKPPIQEAEDFGYRLKDLGLA